VGTFTYNFPHTSLTFNISVPLITPIPKELQFEPQTIGEHLRRRRIELGLYQKDVAKRIGVTSSTIWNWEHEWSIELRYMPRVIEFLGYNPVPCPEDLLERLTWFKLANGLTFEDLGTMMGRSSEQLADWLSGRRNPCRRNRKEIEKFLCVKGVDQKK
jgi:transcriptional regulator with XRE-family HTH domain